ncbi:MAG TPA: ThuA domain-containing protein [Solimonas sp.]|nr:ThuA domain-containing protein [Solimonas sp.]
MKATRYFAAAIVLGTSTLLSSCHDSSGGASTPGNGNGDFKMLVYTRTASFRHASIPIAIQTIRDLGAANRFSVDATEDPAMFSDANLAQYDVVAFVSTTGEILDDTQQAAFERWVQAGGGFVGVHSAADTEYEWPFYAGLIGAYFRNHPVLPLGNPGGPGVQPGDFRIDAPDHPAVAHLPTPWTVSDEFYSFRTNPREQVRVLLSIDEDSYIQDPNTSNLPTSPTFPLGETGSMGDHPMSWCHDNSGGRAWYTALGHSEHMYAMPEYRTHLLNGILTAARRVAADCTPRPLAP